MTRLRLMAVLSAFIAAVVVLVAEPLPSQAQGAKMWVTVKGTVVWPASEPLPKPGAINVTADKEHCLSKGPLGDESILVDPKTRGVRNVWVYLRPANGAFAANDIHPELANAKPKEHVIDQPCCQFIPRVFAARDGDTLLVKNSSPVPHNINYNSDNLSFNQTIPAGGNYKPEKPVQAQKTPHTYACNIHPWMMGKAMVFDHPYFTVTDAEGKFEIKMAPAMALQIFYRHENGYHKGKAGAKGFPVVLNGATMELPPLQLELP